MVLYIADSVRVNGRVGGPCSAYRTSSSVRKGVLIPVILDFAGTAASTVPGAWRAAARRDAPVALL